MYGNLCDRDCDMLDCLKLIEVLCECVDDVFKARVNIACWDGIGRVRDSFNDSV